MIRVATFNVRGFPAMRPRKVVQDYKLIRRHRPDIICWQEQWLPWYRSGIRGLFRKTWAHSLAGGTAGVGITWRTDVFARRWRFSHPLHGSVPGTSGRRRFQGAVLRERATGRDWTVLSAHLTPSAFSRRWINWPARRQAARGAWHEGMERLYEFAEHHVGMGRLVVIGMDANASAAQLRRVFGEHISGKPVRIYSHKVDHVVVIGHVRIDGQETPGGQHSDHQPLIAAFTPREATR